MVGREINDNDRGVPLSTRACAFVGLIIAVTLTLYGYMRGISISFVGPFIIIVCAVILVKGTRQQRRGRRSMFREGPLHFIESQTELATHSPVTFERYTFEENGERRENLDAQESLLHQYENERGTGRASAWMWGRPPSYCINVFSASRSSTENLEWMKCSMTVLRTDKALLQGPSPAQDTRDANAASPPLYQDTMKTSCSDYATSSPFRYGKGHPHHSFSTATPNEVEREEDLMGHEDEISASYDTLNQELPSRNTASPPPYEGTLKSLSDEGLSAPPSYQSAEASLSAVPRVTSSSTS